MHTDFLKRYFDIEQWHQDLFIALLEFKTTWTWQDLSDAFMQVCCHLNTPPGSASQRPAWINNFNRLEWCRIECAKGEEDMSKIIIHAYSPALPRRKPKYRRALLKAVRWSMEHQLIENEWRETIDVANKEMETYSNLPDHDHKKTMKLINRLTNLRDSRDLALKRHRKKFRLAG